jgi:hypothetical protein
MVEQRNRRTAFATAWFSGVACLLLAGCSSLGIGSSARVEKAKAMMVERCKRAGEKIHRTVPDVEGILLLKIRPRDINYSDQFAMTDPYGRDLGGDGYIGSFIKGSSRGVTRTETNAWQFAGYSFVEAVDPKDGKRYRYTGSVKDVVHTSSILMGGDGATKFTTRDFVLDRVLSTDPAPRYGVTYEDISTREEREYWIAGSSLRVIDLQSNEVIAERIGYMMDVGQGDTSAGRSPWQSAASYSCQAFKPPYAFADQRRQTQRFVVKVLVPIDRE